jgi:hypothetical protein
MSQADLIRAMPPFLRTVEQLGIPYYVGGSVASSAHGLARTTLNVDVAVVFEPHHRAILTEHLAAEYFADVLEKLLAALQREGERQEGGYRALQRAHPALAPLWGAWLLKLEGTLAWLTGKAALAS